MVAVALATAAAGIIVGVVALGLGQLITAIIDVLSGGNIFLMLVITAFASLVIGMGLPTTATYIVMASLTAPAIVQIGGFNDFIVPLMSAHLFCFYFGILADDTPPVGLAAYAAAAIAKSPPIPTGLQGFMYDIRTAILPFMFIFNSDLILHNINSWPQGLDFRNGLRGQLRLRIGHPGMVCRQKQNMGNSHIFMRHPDIDAARSDRFAGSVSPTISGTGPISSAWPFSGCFT
jgi:TRAP-type uncharacterized transport system fused permease subunit